MASKKTPSLRDNTVQFVTKVMREVYGQKPSQKVIRTTAAKVMAAIPSPSMERPSVHGTACNG